MTSTLTIRCSDGIGLITLNRPDVMNTLTGEMLGDLGAAYLQCDRDDAVKVIVVTGSGKAFVPGLI